MTGILRHDRYLSQPGGKGLVEVITPSTHKIASHKVRTRMREFFDAFVGKPQAGPGPFRKEFPGNMRNAVYILISPGIGKSSLIDDFGDTAMVNEYHVVVLSIKGELVVLFRFELGDVKTPLF